MSTGSYDYVIPRVLPGAIGAGAGGGATSGTGGLGVLELRLVAKGPPDRLGFGLRYDDENGGELLARLVLRHRLRYGDRSALSLRLGEQSQAALAYTAPLGLTSLVEVGARASGTEAALSAQILGEQKRRTELTQRVAEAGLMASWTPTPNVLLGAALGGGLARSEVTRFSVDANTVFAGPDGAPIVLDPEGVALGERFASSSFFAEARTLDRLNVPTRGLRLRAEFEAGQGRVDGSEFAERIAEQAGVPADSLGLLETRSGAFHRALVGAEALVPVTRRLSLIGRAAYARGSGAGLPLSRRTFVGGMHPSTALPGAFLPLYGHEEEALTGPNAWLGLAGVQWRASTNAFVRLFANAGSTFGDGAALVDADAVLTGVGVDLSYRTPIGPVTLSLGTDRAGRWPDVGLRVGYVF